ncbi:MAG TPA: DUF4395 family protein [Candidatus Krumholzibacteria bacterium]|nr:DUF4395 family protein [Candidatus Krumholzibacteria bacterium]
MGANLNFVRQQGFTNTTVAACEYQYPALMWQPRVIAVLVCLGILIETGWFFLALSAVLWWNVLMPRFNPFDAIYDRLFLKKIGHAPIGPAPAPRRFSQGLAATFMLGIGLAMLKGHDELAWTLQLIVLFVLALLIFGRLCVGAYLYHLITGKRALANKSLPWSDGK